MRVIGLTGGIACGKSNVSSVLKELGATIVDGDRLSRELTMPGGAALPDIRRTFGDGVFLPDGSLDRRALGKTVFSNPVQRKALDTLMQPRLRTMIRDSIAKAKEQGAPLCVLDMPLLYETGLDKLCDRVWCVYLPEEEQLQRLMARDGFTREEAMQRLRSQMPTEEKAARAQVIIDTSGSIDYTRRMIPALYQQELAFQS